MSELKSKFKKVKTNFESYDPSPVSYKVPFTSVLKLVVQQVYMRIEARYTCDPAAALGMIFIPHACPHFL